MNLTHGHTFSVYSNDQRMSDVITSMFHDSGWLLDDDTASVNIFIRRVDGALFFDCTVAFEVDNNGRATTVTMTYSAPEFPRLREGYTTLIAISNDTSLDIFNVLRDVVLI